MAKTSAVNVPLNTTLGTIHVTSSGTTPVITMQTSPVVWDKPPKRTRLDIEEVDNGWIVTLLPLDAWGNVVPPKPASVGHPRLACGPGDEIQNVIAIALTRMRMDQPE